MLRGFHLFFLQAHQLTSSKLGISFSCDVNRWQLLGTRYTRLTCSSGWWHPCQLVYCWYVNSLPTLYNVYLMLMYSTSGAFDHGVLKGRGAGSAS